jgi:hypothetical protein
MDDGTTGETKQGQQEARTAVGSIDCWSVLSSPNKSTLKKQMQQQMPMQQQQHHLRRCSKDKRQQLVRMMWSSNNNNGGGGGVLRRGFIPLVLVAALGLLGIVYQQTNLLGGRRVKAGAAVPSCAATHVVRIDGGHGGGGGVVACSVGNLTPCTHRSLSYNLFSKTNQGHFILDDLLNLIYYQPEIICNCPTPLLLEGLLDYVPQQIRPTHCADEEDFGYYGFYQTSTLAFQVPHHVRIARYREADLAKLFTHVAGKVQNYCGLNATDASHNDNNSSNRILYIQRLDKYGRALPDEYVTPSTATRLLIDVNHNTTLSDLCQVARADLVVVPWGAELVLPIMVDTKFIALKNNYTDVFYYEVLWHRHLIHAELYMDSIPHPKKPLHPYYNNFQPTDEQFAMLQTLVNNSINDDNHSLFVHYPIRPAKFKPDDGFLHQLRLSRRAYLDERMATATAAAAAAGPN